MFASTVNRTNGQWVIGFTIATIAAVMVGLSVGSVLNGLAREDTTTRTATAAFSADALGAVQTARGDGAASAADMAYGLRYAAAAEAYAAAQAAKESDYGLRHPTTRHEPAPSTQRAPGGPQPD